MLNIKNEVLIRLYLVAFVVIGLSAIVSWRLYDLAVANADRWRSKGDTLFLKVVEIEPERGNILAADGSLLATSLPYFDIYFDPKAEGLTDKIFYEQVDSLAWMLATYIDQQYTPGAYRDWLIKLRESPPDTPGIRYVPIAKRLTYEQVKFVKSFPIFRLGRHTGGLIVEQIYERKRPFKILAHRTIGYTRGDSISVGLEGSFNAVLGGQPGKRVMVRVPGDMFIPVEDLSEIEPEPGSDLVTTIDVNIQDVAENALLKALQEHDADHGCVVVMEVKTGAIRAIANLGRTKEGRWWEMFNYAVGERVEPGSVFKLASFMALLEDNHIEDFDQKIPVYGGKIKFYQDELADAIAHGQDSMTIRQVFAQSSNVGTATLVQRCYGDTRRAAVFVERLKQFGLHELTGIEIGGEEPPYIKTPGDSRARWSGTTLPWMSIGYEVMLTPLQLLTFYNAVANDGRRMKPYLVERIEREGKVEKVFKPKTLDSRIASRSTILRARELLREVVETGTARNIRPTLYSLAGKTGTTQLNYHKFRARGGIRYQASFCGFFPADRPVYSCIVVISEPKRGGFHGAEAAAPVFREIADKCFALRPELHVPINAGERPSLTAAQLPHAHAGMGEDLKAALQWLDLEAYVERKWPNYGVLTLRNDSLLVLPRAMAEQLIPSVIGMGLKDALPVLENRGCRVFVRGVGKVVGQSPPPGTPIYGRPTVTLTLK
ncbi:MAG: transpeptidase family protein [Saprospiraceae bacterium]|nr:transpeptidase family protein [Saprospiraceae bacterium]MDW8484263.1 penicillin-binding protein [Saprospiraceae bacterium]